MTAMTLDHLSGGRFVLGIGASGPQVAEGWHGQAYGKPVARAKEYVEVIRKIFAREAPLEHSGEYYQIPYKGPDATGLGKPLKSIVHGRKDLPIYLAAIGPKNVEMAATIADGWLPVFFHPEKFKVFEEPVNSGFAKAAASGVSPGKSFKNFDVAPYVTVAMGPDTKACIAAVKPHVALYVGGMGAKGKNFYNDLACRYGFEEAAEKVQNLYLTGKQPEAIAALPDELVDAVSLCGPKERIAERLAMWKKTPVTTLNINASTPEVLRTMAELVL
jgi:F420-dependent oxidoreductase-like protein